VCVDVSTGTVIVPGASEANFANVNTPLRHICQLKAGLHYGNHRSKLMHFESQEILSMFKKALA
jgi:hypothetical protein